MFPSSQNGLSLVKVLSGISKSLNIAKEIIPIYEQAKPLMQNVSKIFNTTKNTKSKVQNANYKEVSTNKKTTTQSNSLINNPSFFK